MVSDLVWLPEFRAHNFAAGVFLPGALVEGEGSAHPSIDVKGIVTIRLHRLHFS